jgi:competence protein ComEA
MHGDRSFEHRPDWTQGPAKWAAAVVLGAACILTIAWVMTSRVNAHEPSRAGDGITSAGSRPTPPPPTASAATPLAADLVGPPIASSPAPPPLALTGTPVEPATSAEPPREHADAAPTSATPTTSPAPLTRLINLNTATAAELELLPGVGPRLAERIIAHRSAHGRFVSVNDLDKVPGVGPRTLERLRPLVTVD